MPAQLFPNVSLDAIDKNAAEDLATRLARELDSTSSAVTLLWSRGFTVQIASIQVRDLTAGGGWRELLPRRWMGDGGEFSYPLGLYAPGTELQVMVVAMAMEADIPQAAAAVSVQPGGRVTQIIPTPPARFEPMARGTTWAREGKVKV